MARVLSRWDGCASEIEMAGDWNSLGIAIHVPAELGAEEMLEIANALVVELARAKSDALLTCGWSAGIYKNGELLKALGPESQVARRCAVCGCEQEVGRGDTCRRCGSALSQG